MKLIEVILPRGRGSNFMKLLKTTGAHAITCYYGYGSAPAGISKTLHVDKIKKEIVMAIVDDDHAYDILNRLEDSLSKKNTGVAFTIPLDVKGSDILDNSYDYVALNIIVDRQDGHKALEIAQANGARGATLIHGRGSAEKVKSILLNMNIEPEKDLVEQIREAILAEMNLEEENKGIIYSLPVMDVRGLVGQN